MDQSINQEFNSDEKDELVYVPTPREMSETLKLIDPTNSLPSTNMKNRMVYVYKFVEDKVESKKIEAKQNLKKNFPLGSIKKKIQMKRTNGKKKKLTSIEKRTLGLLRLPKTGLQYKSFIGLHQLWLGYIKNLLELEISMASSNQDLLHTRLAKADYHGCLLMVARSKCPPHVGLKGIVLIETKNTFQIICEDDQIKTIPKMNSVFTLTIDSWTFTIFGNQFNVRPSERASRKYKSRSTIDL